MSIETRNRELLLLTSLQQVSVVMTNDDGSLSTKYLSPKDARHHMACVQMYRGAFRGRPLFFGRDDKLVCFLPVWPRSDSTVRWDHVGLNQIPPGDIVRWNLMGWYNLFRSDIDESWKGTAQGGTTRLDELQVARSVPGYDPRSGLTRVRSTREVRGRFGEVHTYQNYEADLTPRFAHQIRELGVDSPSQLFGEFHRGIDLVSLLTAGFWYGDL